MTNQITTILLIGLLMIGGQVFCQNLKTKDKQAILQLLAQQESCWNEGDLACFMRTAYWQSDSLTFIGSKGLTHGWQSTLDNYRRSYPNQQAMGKLHFDILSMQKAGSRAAYVVGKWSLAREGLDDLSGHFSLLWRKIKGQWRIVSDHSS